MHTVCFRTGSGATRSDAVPVVVGAVYAIEVRLASPGNAGAEGTPQDTWPAVGLAPADGSCDAASVEAPGDQRALARAVRVRLGGGPGHRAGGDRCGVGTGPSGRRASAAGADVGADPGPAQLILRGASARSSSTGGCVVAAGAR